MSGSAHNAGAAQALIDTLVAGGLAYAVVSPGSRNTPLVLALDAAMRERTHVVLDERTAGFVALGLARVAKAPVALVCTSGSAAAHYLPAVVEAHYDALPLVVLSADRPPELHHCGAGQTIEQAQLFGAYVRGATDLGSVDETTSPRAVASAGLRALVAAASGPTHVNVAFREPLWTPGDVYAAQPEMSPRLERPKSRVDVEGVAALAQRLDGAARGVIVCGPRSSDEPAFAGAVCALAQRLGWPVLADATSGVRFAGGEVVVASYDALLRHEPFARASAPEVVLRFGQLPASKPLARWLEEHASGRAVVVDAHGMLNDPSHGLDTWIVADPLGLTEALGRAVRKRAADGWLAHWQRAEVAAQRALAAECGDGLWEGAIARAVVESLPEGALLHVASSMPVRDLESFAPATTKALAVTCNRGANGIDGTIATLLGEALAWTSGPAVAVLGDLAFLHDHASLVAARELGAGLTLVVIDNGGGGIFDFLPISGHPAAYERYFRTPHQADLGALARAAGFSHERVDDLGALRSALARDDRRAQRVIQARVSANDNVARHKNAWARVARALTEVA